MVEILPKKRLCSPGSKLFNPIALRMAKTLWSFGHSESNRVKNRPVFGRVSLSRGANKKLLKLRFSLQKCQKNMLVYLYSLILYKN